MNLFANVMPFFLQVPQESMYSIQTAVLGRPSNQAHASALDECWAARFATPGRPANVLDPIRVPPAPRSAEVGRCYLIESPPGPHVH